LHLKDKNIYQIEKKVKRKRKKSKKLIKNRVLSPEIMAKSHEILDQKYKGIENIEEANKDRENKVYKKVYKKEII
jgi:hypothetical protein